MVRIEVYGENEDIHLCEDPQDGRPDRKFLELAEEFIARYQAAWSEWDDVQWILQDAYTEAHGPLPSTPSPKPEEVRENTLAQEIEAMKKVAAEIGTTPGKLLDRTLGIAP